ncbi:MAG TPA: 50S ribosomal protein L11 methyltransferase [Terriglobales bacterium]|nr:50S ribosomal protein L11 methyltransferase [Terriglobales bacterium]
MEYRELTIETNFAGLEMLTGMLTAAGVAGCTVCDPRDFEEFLAGTQTHWDYVEEDLMALRDALPSVTCYIPEGEQGDALLSLVRQKLIELSAEGVWGPLTLKMNTVAEEDWADNWKQYFKPLTVGEKLLIKPSWEEVEDAAGRVILEIDPASSFGTGAHHTTQLCLTELEGLPAHGAKVLDMGCGSGILGIAAVLLGADRVTMVDIDENAVKTAGENARKNGIEAGRLLLLSGDVTGDDALAEKIGGEYDIVLANIVADVILGMRRELAAALRSGGTLVVSGILEERAHEVAQGLSECGLAPCRTASQGGWSALVFLREGHDSSL